MKKLTITIGIPAYNEEANIRSLLQTLLKQKKGAFTLKRIIVFSDCSNDETVAEAKRLKSKLIRVYSNTRRVGQALTQNKILALANTDVVVLLNGDTQVKPSFLSSIAKELIKNPWDYLVPKAVPTSPSNYFSRVINFSVDFRTELFEKINGGDTAYLCGGRARVLSRRLAKHLRWPNVMTEDSYSYLFAKRHEYRTTYLHDTVVYFSSPSHFADHERQSRRFLSGVDELTQYFSRSFVVSRHAIPFSLFAFMAMVYFIKSPKLFLSYLIIAIVVRVRGPAPISPLWDSVQSSKNKISL